MDRAFLFDSLFSHSSSDFLSLCGTGAVRVCSSVSAPHYWRGILCWLLPLALPLYPCFPLSLHYYYLFMSSSWFLYIFWILLLYWMWVGKNLYPFCRLLLCPVDVSLALQKLFSFMRSYVFVELSICAISILFRTTSPVPMYSRLFLSFSSIRFSVSGFMFLC